MATVATQPAQPGRPGAILRALRAKHGWTLADVSRRTGLPISTLSKVENDRMSLSFDKLMRISTGLGIDIGVLFSAERPEPAPVVQLFSGRRSITRAGEGTFVDTGNYAQLYPATELLNKQLVPLIQECKARTLAEFGELVRHSGEEYALVLDGAIDFHTDLYAPVRLTRGDSIYFDSSMAHGYIAAADGTCRILSICSTVDWVPAAAEAERPRPPRVVRATA